MSSTNPGPAITNNPVPVTSVGNIQKEAIISTVSITPVSVAANTTAQQSFANSGLGLLPGDVVEYVGSPGAFQAGLLIVSAAASPTVNDTLIITFGNLTASPITPNAGAYQFDVSRLQPNEVIVAGSGYMNAF